MSQAAGRRSVLAGAGQHEIVRSAILVAIAYAVAAVVTAFIEGRPDRPHDLSWLAFRYVTAATVAGLLLSLFMGTHPARSGLTRSLAASYTAMGLAAPLVALGIWLLWFSSGSYVQQPSNLAALTAPFALTFLANLLTVPLALRRVLHLEWAVAVAMTIPVVVAQLIGLFVGAVLIGG